MDVGVPIQTELGILSGRDCIYFDTVKQDDMDNLVFTGDINGALVKRRKNEKEWFLYELTIKRVLTYFVCELDTYINIAGAVHLDSSSFDIINESLWLKTLPIRTDFERSIYKHYRLFTYDFVYNIIAVSYEMKIK